MKPYTLLNDLLFKKLFTTEGNQYILLQFIKDMTGLEFESITLRETYRIDEYRAKWMKQVEQLEKASELYETIVDLSGQLSDGTMISVELQVKNHYKFIERSLYYTANTYVNQYTKDRKYATLRPVISINVINFPLRHFESRTLEKFVLKNEDNESLLGEENQELMRVIYFSLVNETDEDRVEYWRKLFLNLEIDEKAPKAIHDANQLIDYQRLSEDEKMIITREERMRANFEAVREYELSESRKQGIEQGLEKGVAQGLAQAAQNMLLKGLDITMISDVTGLSIEEIEAISL